MDNEKDTYLADLRVERVRIESGELVTERCVPIATL